MSFSAVKAVVFPTRLQNPQAGTLFHKLCIGHLSAGFRLGTASAFFSLFIFLFPAPCGADILIEPRVGFHGVFQLGRPFPLAVELDNSGRPAEGLLEVRIWKGGATKGGLPYPLVHRREIFLPAQARKTVQFTVDPDFISRPLAITFFSPAARAAREIDLRRHFSPAPVMLLASEGLSLPPMAQGSSAQNRLVALTLAELPADARALLGVSHLILYEPSMRELSRSQLLALDAWLSAGGRMVILGSLNYALYQEPLLARFLPVRVTGAKRISFVPLAGKNQLAAPIAPSTRVPALAGDSRSGFRPMGIVEGVMGLPVGLHDVWAQASTAVGGKVLADAQGIPLLVEASRGKGRVTYLALDVGRPPLSRWEGLAGFLQNLLAAAPGDDPAPLIQWDERIFSQLVLTPSFISAYVPNRSLFFAMVGYLIGLGVLTWLWQRRSLPLASLWIGCAAWAALTGGAGHFFFSRGGNIPDGVLLAATVIENGADGYVEAQSNLALFSTQVRQYHLRLERGWMDLTPVAARFQEGAEPVVVLAEGGGASRYRLALREWDYRLFRLRAIERFPLRAEFEPEGEQLRMRVDNRSAKDLTDCWLILPGRRYALGDLPSGSSWNRLFPLARTEVQQDRGLGRAEAFNFHDLKFSDKTREILFHSSFFPRGNVGFGSGDAALFFGWVKDPQRRVGVDDPAIQVRDYTLFRAVVPLGGAQDE